MAENYDRYLEVMYAHDDHHANFQEFYLKLAKQYGAVDAKLPYLVRTNQYNPRQSSIE